MREEKARKQVFSMQFKVLNERSDSSSAKPTTEQLLAFEDQLRWEANVQLTETNEDKELSQDELADILDLVEEIVNKASKEAPEVPFELSGLPLQSSQPK